MKSTTLSYRIFPLGDAAVTVDFGNIIDKSINQQVLHLFNSLQNDPLPGMKEVVPAYSSLAVYYNAIDVRKKHNGSMTAFDSMSAQIKERLDQSLTDIETVSKLVSIPVCYEKELAPDIEYLANAKSISVDELIRMHTSKEYRVYMLGFLPGFSYMGEVDEKIAIARKPQPITVASGSVGIAGRQTGIYPMTCPGGWQIIGRTPVQLFDPGKDEPTLLKAGDRVQFISISKDEFENY
ncbi:MAG: 5-oxoprolinase subunit PxpB [Chitinophagaceae bacterium]|nr:5-oxoprolinase subunit PxpB [Chitinophagaceae bacterium]